ncbi:MAG: hypothetical protein KJO69_04120, partial [Gammaproteobacteria bacterium]|nr:hypothetical protein [Gammaproteobacteria bacterium]
YSLTGNNAQMETSFSNHNISLSAYVDKFVKFRALYRHDGFHYTGTEANVSFLIDNVTLTDAKSVVNSSLIDINATNSFSFTPASGKQYALAVRAIPWDGYPGTDWGPIFYATASAQDDNDGDGEPDSSDTDDDNDGVPDISDAYPLISLDGRVDTDNDGAPDNCDSACLATGMLADTDDDGDGFTDQEEIEAGTSPTDPNNYPKGSTILKILPLLLNQE